MVSLAETIRQLASLVSHTSNALLKNLKQDSSQLATISEEFPKWLREREASLATEAEIICFTEEKATGRLGEKVSELCLHTA